MPHHELTPSLDRYSVDNFCLAMPPPGLSAACSVLFVACLSFTIDGCATICRLHTVAVAFQYRLAHDRKEQYDEPHMTISWQPLDTT